MDAVVSAILARLPYISVLIFFFVTYTIQFVELSRKILNFFSGNDPTKSYNKKKLKLTKRMTKKL